MDDSEILTAKEAGQFLKYQESTVYAKAAQGKLPFIRLWKGKRKSAIRFSRSDLLKHIRQNAVPAK